jgi:hypothetical protein
MKKLLLSLVIFLVLIGSGFCETVSSISNYSFVEFPQYYQFSIDYDDRTDGQPVYIGYAPKGSAAGDNDWLIFMFTYNESDQVLTRKSAFGNWTDRATLSYN